MKTWHAAKTENHQGLVIEDETGRNVAVIYDKADAPLVAEAPAMLEALKVIDRAGSAVAQLEREMPSFVAAVKGARSILQRLGNLK